MANSTSKLICASTLKRHVCNKVRHLTHLCPLYSTSCSGDGRIFGNLVDHRIKALQPFESWGTFNRSPIIGNEKNRISIKVGTRQSLGYRMMNTDSVSCCSTQHLACLTITIVHCQLRNFKRSTMRESDKSYTLSISHIR